MSAQVSGLHRDSGAVGQVHDARVDAQLAQALQRHEEVLFLLAGLLALRRRGERLRGRQVRQDAAEAQVPALRQLSREAIHIARRYAQAVHPGVHFQVKRDGLAAPVFGGGLIERVELLAAMNHRREAMLHKTGFFAGPETGQHQDGLAHSSFANRDAFRRAGHAEPVRSSLLENFGHLRPAMAVAIALHDGQNHPGRLAVFVRGIHMVADGAKIVGERGDGDFGPDRASCDFDVVLLLGCHRFPEEKNSVRHPRGTGRNTARMPRERQHPSRKQLRSHAGRGWPSWACSA